MVYILKNLTKKKFVPCSKAPIELTDSKAPDYNELLIMKKNSYNGQSDTVLKGKCANYFNINKNNI